MKTYIFNLSADLWLTNLEIEADSEEEAREILYQMNARELIASALIKDMSLSNIDIEVEDDDDWDSDDDEEE